ncbi:MAG: peptidoglycan-binding protein [Cyanobacteria bacterium P01_E01_bin.42]
MKKFLLLLISLLFAFSPITSAARSPDRPILRIGSQGEEVRELQAALLLLGFYRGAVDGRYSESTVIAVSRFQEAANLPIDGIMGVETWQRLFPPSPVLQAENNPPPPSPPPESASPENPSQINPILRSGMRGEAVRRLQERLRRLGILSGEVDGIFGEQTLEAVKTFQQRNNLTVDGVVGAQTWEILLR